MLRQAIASSLSLPYKDIQLTRTDKGKPVLVNEHKNLPNFNFNVSHQGSLAVIAAEPIHQVGIDVMQIEYPSEWILILKAFGEHQHQYYEMMAIDLSLNGMF